MIGWRSLARHSPKSSIFWSRFTAVTSSDTQLSMALAAYRQVLRSTRIAFQGTHFIKRALRFRFLRVLTSAGDFRILSASRIEARSKLDSNRSLSPHSPELQQKISEAVEIARILRQNIVQGEQLDGPGNGDQRYRAYSTPQ